MKDSSAFRSSSSSSMQSKQQQLRQLQLEQLQLETQLRVQRFAANYEVEIAWPAIILNNRRTSSELIQHRLLEAGLLYEVPTNLNQILESANRFVANLEESQCFKSVRVLVGEDKSSSESSSSGGGDSSSSTKNQTKENARPLTVHLQEANWYRLHAGGGVKTTSLLGEQAGSASSSSMFPTAELECSLGLRNLTGYLDLTQLQYTLDSHSISTWRIHHQRPFYSILPYPFREWVLQQSTGSQALLEVQAALDTVDHQWTRSYKEFQRLLSAKVATKDSWNLEWSILGRDLVPRRHATLPYCFAASPEIVSQAGPNVRHAISLEYKTKLPLTTPPIYVANAADEDFSSISSSSSRGEEGVHVSVKAQLATPPGDIGFFKLQGGLLATSKPILSSWSKSRSLQFQTSLHAGYLHSLTYGGLTPRGASCLSDRFFVGGPLQLRGFSPAGIGPRSRQSSPPPPAAAKSGSSKQNSSGHPGDSLGGDFYYTATFLASIQPSTLLASLSSTHGNSGSGSDSNSGATSDSWSQQLRLFGFVNLGTCIGHVASTPWLSILRSTRTSVGVGLALSTSPSPAVSSSSAAANLSGGGSPRLELTYAIPLRYGSHDIRRAFQFGMGFTI